jgi:tRNA dimethylallyltransferase
MLVLACRRPREELATRIAARCDAMLAAGLLDEIRGLEVRGCSEAPALDSVGYREMRAYLHGALAYEDAVEQFRRATRRLAKRQMTWWRSASTVSWFHPDRDGAAMAARALAWLVPACRSPISTSSNLSPR